MNISLLLLSALLLFSCASQNGSKHGSAELVVEEIHPDKKTALAHQNLLHLNQVYHLEPLLFTKKIQVTSQGLPKSHPVLTLTTKFAGEPNKLLAQLLHEQFHWWLTLNPAKMSGALIDLKKVYPEIPKDNLIQDTLSGYSHLIICYLEHAALTHYIGKKAADDVIKDFMQTHKIFPWTNFQILNRNFVIKKIVDKHDLLPSPLF